DEGGIDELRLVAGSERFHIGLVALHIDLGIGKDVGAVAAGEERLTAGGVDGGKLQGDRGGVKGNRSAWRRGDERLKDQRESAGNKIGLPEIREQRGNGGAGMKGGVFGGGEVDGNARSESAPVRGINGLRIEGVNLSGAGSEIAAGISLSIHGEADGSAIVGFADRRVEFVAQTVGKDPARRKFP